MQTIMTPRSNNSPDQRFGAADASAENADSPPEVAGVRMRRIGAVTTKGLRVDAMSKWFRLRQPRAPSEERVVDTGTAPEVQQPRIPDRPEEIPPPVDTDL